MSFFKKNKIKYYVIHDKRLISEMSWFIWKKTRTYENSSPLLPSLYYSCE